MYELVDTFTTISDSLGHVVRAFAESGTHAVESTYDALGGQPVVTAQVQAVDNPFPGSPDFNALGPAFDTWWKRLFAALWGLAIVVVGFFFIGALVEMGKAGEDDPHAHARGKKKVKNTGIALVALVGLGIILGAVLLLAG